MESSVIAIHQVWQNKYSGERVRISSHVFQFIWDCINTRSKKTTQITEFELSDGWKLLNEKKR